VYLGSVTANGAGKTKKTDIQHFPPITHTPTQNAAGGGIAALSPTNRRRMQRRAHTSLQISRAFTEYAH